jgi:hypothetical protein
MLRIGRTAAYEQTRRYEETEGREGIPVDQVGRLRRVPRAALERWSGGPLTSPRCDQGLQGGLQPPPTAQRPRLPGPSGRRCSPHPPMSDSR